MDLFTSIVVYFLIWWVVIFCVLPLNIESITDAKKTGNMPGAPVNPGLKRKAILTTIISCFVWLAIDLAIRFGGISFRDMAEHMAR